VRISQGVCGYHGPKLTRSLLLHIPIRKPILPTVPRCAALDQNRECLARLQCLKVYLGPAVVLAPVDEPLDGADDEDDEEGDDAVVCSGYVRLGG
jgi:hypothetical protein